MDPLLCLTKADLADPETAARDLPPARGAVRRDPARRATSPSSASGSTAGPACWSATPASASRRWSTRWCRTRPRDRRGQRGDRPRRHTSTSALHAARCPDGGWIVDTPGIRSFGLAHVDPDQLIEAFPDLHDVTDDCPRGCTHGEAEPECALDEAHRAADAERVASFRRLLASREAGDAAY